MKQIIGCLAALSLSLAGCSLLKINVNGKQMGFGASEPSAESQTPNAPGEVAPNDNRVVEHIVLAPSDVNEVPRLVRATAVGMNAPFRKTLGFESPDCGSDTSEKPIATFELKQEMPKTFVVAVAGGRNDGFVLLKDGLLWSTCTQRIGEFPAMGAPAEGWTPGKYSVHPVARSGGKKGVDFTVEFYDPAHRAVWSNKVQTLSISKKLDKPLFVDVTLKPGRIKLREDHSGYQCEKLPLPLEPDLAITLERPIAGLTVRPLYTKSPVGLRVQEPDAGKSAGRKYCSSYQRTVVAGGYSPSWESAAEYHFQNQAEGRFGFSLGSDNPDESHKVTLMIFDASTKFDPLAALTPSGALPLEERILERYYPQLDTRELNLYKHAQLVTHSTLFASAPKELFVYAKLDLDKEIARLLTGHVDEASSYPKKDEPLLLLSMDQTYATVLTADAVRYQVKATHVLPEPSGPVAKLTAPRALKKDVRYGDLVSMAPPTAKTITASYDAAYAKYQSCADRAWAPYAKKLNGATWTVSYSDGSSTRVESPAAQKIRDDGDRAIDKACGTEEAMDKRAEGSRAKLQAAVEQERAAQLKKATTR